MSGEPRSPSWIQAIPQCFSFRSPQRPPTQRKIHVGAEVKYDNYSGATVARDNGDGMYNLDIPGLGMRTVPIANFEYMIACIELKLANVNYPLLAANDETTKRFVSSVKQAISSEVGMFQPSDMSVELYQTSFRAEKRWRSAMLVRASIIPPIGTTAGALCTAMSKPGSMLAQTVTDVVIKEVVDLPRVPDHAVSTIVNTVTVTPHRTPLAAPRLYEEQPDFFCWYYNADDPRTVVCGRDAFQCGQPSPAPNIATDKGRCLFAMLMPFVILAMPCRAIC